MSLIKAIVIKAQGEAAIESVPIPTLRPDYINVKTAAYALNPTDWKHIDFMATTGARVGCDYSGTVLAVGPAVTKDFKPGDRVCGFCHGAKATHLESGAFAEVITAKGDVQIRIPDNLSFEEASTLGVGITTVGQGLFQSLKLPLPNQPSKEKFPLLIYGGSTATGTLAIQIAKLSGLEVITTCSPRNFDYMRELGADEVFDYNSPTCVQDIKKYTKGNLHHVFDCISEESTYPICVESFGEKGGVYSTLLAVDPKKVMAINPNVESKYTLGYTVNGEDIRIRNNDIPAKPEDFEFGKMWWEVARGLLEQGKVKVHRPSVNEGGKGLEGVLGGLQLLKGGKVSGKKLVYTAD